MAIIGYARVSTLAQNLQAQISQLREAGCAAIHQEKASGKGGKARPVLDRLLRDLKAGDTLVVVQLDRIARSLAHLLTVVEAVRERGAAFRSLRDPVDTAGPQGTFLLHILGAVAELERRLIIERTYAGLAAARAEGRIGGNPRIKAGDTAHIRAVMAKREDNRVERLVATAEDWAPIVQRMRPHNPWRVVLQELNANLHPGGLRWKEDRLLRSCKILVHQGLLSKQVLERHRRGSPPQLTDQTLGVLATLKRDQPNRTLRDLGRSLTAMRIRTPHGNKDWAPSSVLNALRLAETRGFFNDPL